MFKGCCVEHTCSY